MAEMSLEGGTIVLDFGEDGKRDVIFASSVAKHAARSLERLAGRAIASKQLYDETGPTIEVRCVLHNGKPLVQWVLARWCTEKRISPRHALALAKDTRAAAQEAERVARWAEFREPRALMS